MKKQKSKGKKEVVLILNNIRSAYNVGSIFRTADTAGVSKIFLTGYTPAPNDRFGREVKEITKVALGDQKYIKWEKNSIEKTLKILRQSKFQIIAVEQNKKSVDYKKIKPKFPVAFIFGNEITGIEPKVLKASDLIAEIPMRRKLARNRPRGEGRKESLNVSVAAGIILFRMLNL